MAWSSGLPLKPSETTHFSGASIAGEKFRAGLAGGPRGTGFEPSLCLCAHSDDRDQPLLQWRNGTGWRGCASPAGRLSRDDWRLS